MNINNMTNEELDYQVAKAIGLADMLPDKDIERYIESYSPTSDWKQCGKLIENYQIHVDPTTEFGRQTGVTTSWEAWGINKLGKLISKGDDSIKVAICKVVGSLLEEVN